MYEYPHPQTASSLHRYHVRLGMNRVTVDSSDPDEAIVAARRVFCREMPRMWDVIQRLEPSRFEVECLE